MNTTSRLLLSVIFITAISCASMSSIVKNPEIHQVKKIAIISLTAPQRVPHKNGKGEVGGWGKDNRAAIADQALAAYAAEFKKLGWEVISSAQLAALPIYQENFAPKLSKANNGVAKTLNAVSTMDAENTYFSPTGLFPIAWDEEKRQGGTLRLDLANFSIEKNKSLLTKMQEVASAAGVDAAVLVRADYCYEDGSFWVGHAGSGTGTAVITGASAVYAVTPKGDEVIKMHRIPGGCGDDHRVASDSSTSMVEGHLLGNDDRVRKMFLEVARKSAASNVKEIQNAIRN